MSLDATTQTLSSIGRAASPAQSSLVGLHEEAPLGSEQLDGVRSRSVLARSAAQERVA